MRMMWRCCFYQPGVLSGSVKVARLIFYETVRPSANLIQHAKTEPLLTYHLPVCRFHPLP
jgi:hypothetical protein